MEQQLISRQDYCCLILCRKTAASCFPSDRFGFEVQGDRTERVVHVFTNLPARG